MRIQHVILTISTLAATVILDAPSAMQGDAPRPLNAASSSSSGSPISARFRIPWTVQNADRRLDGMTDQQVSTHIQSYLNDPYADQALAPIYTYVLKQRLNHLERDQDAPKALRGELRQELMALSGFNNNDEADPADVPTAAQARATMAELKSLEIPDYDAQSRAFRLGGGGPALLPVHYDAINQLARMGQDFLSQPEQSQTPSMTAAYYNALAHQYNKFRALSSTVELPENVNTNFMVLGTHVMRLRARLEDMGAQPCGNGDARQACEGLHEGEYPV